MKKNKKMGHQKFIETYEKKIKKYRQEYYNNFLTQKSPYSKGLYVGLLFLPLIIAIITLLIGNFNIVSHIIALFLLILFNIIIKIVFKMFSLDEKNNYLNEIRKLGYFSIEDYEDKIRKYITGPNGYYDSLRNDIMQKYNISESTRKIQLLNGDLYFIWTSPNQDKIYMFNSRSNSKPEIIEIRTSGIRYFRCDYTNNFIVLKTDIKDFYLKMESLDILNELIKEKKFENITGYDPEIYINDFELSMHKVKNEINSNNEESTQNKSYALSLSIVLLIACIFIIFIKLTLNKYILLLNLIEIIIFLILNSNIRTIISVSKTNNKDDSVYIDKINKMPECKNNFEELKIALGIKNTYDKVYTDEGACYLTWIANGYFHVFLNIIYFNVVYISVKVSDVIYYKLEKNECLIKLKDKTLHFTKDAINVFSKILPNKDYEWLKGFQTK